MKHEIENDIPFDMQPTNAQVIAEQQRTGGSFDQTQERLTTELNAGAKKFRELAPVEFDAIESRIEAAKLELEESSDLLNSRRTMIRELESQILSVGKKRSDNAQMKTMLLPPEREAEYAEAILDARMETLSNESPETVSRYNNGLQSLAHAKAIAPHVAKFIAQHETTIADLISRIKSTAEKEGVNVGNLLKIMEHDASDTSNGSLNNVAFIQHAAAGYFADLI